ncbi:MAG: helix-turn-helix domain-containing protein [Peptococcaceae bacterium]|jgi:transcriptional regulator with XRE-family HTH domain|nr:helix-turn-helix domain-containing protein [Peptococcaceae bacterium]
MEKLPIGKMIYSMRKERGATQEDLAHSVGVSVPAVSKWESSQAYPDISLLPSIARYFNTTIDRLLDYELDITEEEVMALLKSCGEVFEEDGVSAGVNLCEQYLYRYPNNLFFKLRTGSLYLTYLNLAISEAAAEDLSWKAIRLLEMASESDNNEIAYSAYYLLSALYAFVGHSSKSEEALSKIPKNPINPEDMLVPLYIQQNRFDDALKLLQTNMLSRLQYVCRALGSYSLICGKVGKPEMEKALLHQGERLAEMFSLDPGTRITCYLELAGYYARQASGSQVMFYMHKLEDCLLELSQKEAREYYRENPLFTHVEVMEPIMSLPYFRSILIKCFEYGEEYGFLRQDQDFLNLVERLSTIWSD